MTPSWLHTMNMISVALLLQLAGITITIHVDSYLGARHKRVMRIITGIMFSLLLEEYLDYLIVCFGLPVLLRTAVFVYRYSIIPVLIVLLYFLIEPGKLQIVLWIFTMVNGTVYLTAFFSGITFKITGSGEVIYGPLGYCVVVTGFIMVFYLLFISARQFRQARHLEKWIPVLNAVVVMIAAVCDLFVRFEISMLLIAMVSCSIFYYIWLHLQFVRAHENALQAEQRIQIMISQIQPHFLYNTLSTIQALCRTDPEKASEITGMFGEYLRRNIDSLRSAELIPIEKELNHTKIYADIETTRFPNIEVRYNIEDEEFMLPALTIQPIVENAIRHGVRIRQKGLIEVSVRKMPEYHEIIIRDNGKGFDVSALNEPSGEHIGISNVRERIEKMCGGTMVIDSTRDKGTTVIIHIP